MIQILTAVVAAAGALYRALVLILLAVLVVRDVLRDAHARPAPHF